MMSLKNLNDVGCQDWDFHIQQWATDYRWSLKCLYVVFSDREFIEIFFSQRIYGKIRTRDDSWVFLITAWIKSNPLVSFNLCDCSLLLNLVWKDHFFQYLALFHPCIDVFVVVLDLDVWRHQQQWYQPVSHQTKQYKAIPKETVSHKKVKFSLAIRIQCRCWFTLRSITSFVHSYRRVGNTWRQPLHLPCRSHLYLQADGDTSDQTIQKKNTVLIKK